jgi:hypothetical protein
MNEVFENGQIKVFGGPSNESLQVNFADGPNWVEIRRGTIVFSQVYSEINVM